MLPKMSSECMTLYVRNEWQNTACDAATLTSQLLLFTCPSRPQYKVEQELKRHGKADLNNKFLIADTAAPSVASMPKSQRFFVTTFVKPLLDELMDVLPTFYEEATVNLASNLEHWDSLVNNIAVQGPHPGVEV